MALRKNQEKKPTNIAIKKEQDEIDNAIAIE